MNKQDVANKLRDHGLEWMPVNKTRDAAVLIPLIQRGDDYLDVVLEVRAGNITQGGEVCLPGGVIEEGETTRDAAIRETCEELLVDPSQIEVICPMVATGGPLGRVVESYLGTIENYNGTYAETEVDHILTVPLRFFYSAEPIVGDIDLIAQIRDNFPTHLLEREKGPWFSNVPRSYYFYEFKGHVIWGLTASILRETARIIYGDEHPTREYD